MMNGEKKLLRYDFQDKTSTKKNQPIKYTQKISAKQKGIKLLIDTYKQIKISELSNKLVKQYPMFFSIKPQRNPKNILQQAIGQQKYDSYRKQPQKQQQPEWLSDDSQQFTGYKNQISIEQIQRANIQYKDVDKLLIGVKSHENQFFQEEEKKKKLRQQQNVNQFVDMGLIAQVDQKEQNTKFIEFGLENYQLDNSSSQSSGQSDDVLGDEEIKLDRSIIQRIQQDEKDKGKVFIKYRYFKTVIEQVNLKQEDLIWVVADSMGKQYRVSTQIMDENYFGNNWYIYLPFISLKFSQFVNYQQLLQPTTLSIFMNQQVHKPKKKQIAPTQKVTNQITIKKKKKMYKPKDK